jgi:hypothetical protein
MACVWDGPEDAPPPFGRYCDALAAGGASYAPVYVQGLDTRFGRAEPRDAATRELKRAAATMGGATRATLSAAYGTGIFYRVIYLDGSPWGGYTTLVPLESLRPLSPAHSALVDMDVAAREAEAGAASEASASGSVGAPWDGRAVSPPPLRPGGVGWAPTSPVGGAQGAGVGAGEPPVLVLGESGGGGEEEEVESGGDGGSVEPPRRAKTRRRASAAGTEPARAAPRSRPPDVSPKWWKRRYSLWSRFDEGVCMDAEGWWSVTPEGAAAAMAAACVEAADASDGGGCSIMDLFSGLGGNAISFALAQGVSSVHAIELRADRCAMLEHNAKLYGVRTSRGEEEGDGVGLPSPTLRVARGDALAALRSLPSLPPDRRPAVLFLAPPWGGLVAAHAQGGKYSLGAHMSVRGEGGEVVDGLALLAACVSAARAAGSVRVVAAFLPRNTDIRELEGLQAGGTGVGAPPRWVVTSVGANGEEGRGKKKRQQDSVGLLAILRV